MTQYGPVVVAYSPGEAFCNYALHHARPDSYTAHDGCFRWTCPVRVKTADSTHEHYLIVDMSLSPYHGIELLAHLKVDSVLENLHYILGNNIHRQVVPARLVAGDREADPDETVWSFFRKTGDAKVWLDVGGKPGAGAILRCDGPIPYSTADPAPSVAPCSLSRKKGGKK